MDHGDGQTALHHFHYLNSPLNPLPPPGHQTRPTCALYFSYLINARWNNFSRVIPASKCSEELNQFLRFHLPYKANRVGDSLERRLFLVSQYQAHTQLVKDEMTKGTAAQNAKAFASRKLILTAARGGSTEESEVDEWIRGFDGLIARGRGWKALLDMVGVPEVLLADFDEGDAFYWNEGIPIPCAAMGRDGHALPLQDLLSPTLGLKETCLKLSGVVDMIQRLRRIPGHSDDRTRLAAEIETRVRDVFGGPDACFGAGNGVYPGNEDDDMVDPE